MTKKSKKGLPGGSSMTGKRDDIEHGMPDLMTAMEQIVGLARDSGLSDNFLRRAGRPIGYIAGRLSLTPVQCALLAVFVDSHDDTGIRICDLAGKFDCTNVRMLRFVGDIDVLVERGYVRRRRRRGGNSYMVRQDALDALSHDRDYVKPAPPRVDCSGLFVELDELFRQYLSDDEIDYDGFNREVIALFDANRHLLFVRRMADGGYLSNGWVSDDGLLLLYFCHRFVNDGRDELQSHDIEDIFPSRGTWRDVKSQLENGTNELMQDGWVEYANADGMADRGSFCLTGRAKRDLLAELDISAPVHRGVLKCTDLTAKRLYYNEREEAQVRRLAELLAPESYDGIRARLSSRGMRTGFTCLFYGSPGTGKTETVYQLARQSGRDIVEVNVEQVKSMWVGESEKNVKALFDNYRRVAKAADRVPILLFNEADALIGRRLEGADRAVDKMENSVQNIILQEMERLDGIMIATTNLTQNMDKAFERRFLYKIRFDRPCTEAKKAIWRTMIPDLPDSDAGTLAARYDFSGGQIENVARKRAVASILSGDGAVSIDELRAMCDEENIAWSDGRAKIGF